MAIGNIKVTVGQNNPSKVTLGPNQPQVAAIQYGSRTLKSASDLNMSGVHDGDVITYDSATDSFVMEQAHYVLPDVDNGFF